MKKLLSILLLISATVCLQCGSSNDDPNPNPNPGDLNATATSPETLYADDEVTITGSGFSTTKTDNAVVLGIYANNIFTEVTPAGGSGLTSYHVVSATATQLVIAADDAEYLDKKLEDYYDYGFKITVGDNSVIVPVGKIRKFVIFHMGNSTVINKVQGCSMYLTAGDSVVLTGQSFYGNCSLSIANKGVSVKEIGDDHNKIAFRIPKDLFGHLEDDCLEDEMDVTITNGDGKSFTTKAHFAKSPPMRIWDASFDKQIYKKGSGNAVLTLEGYCIYSGAMVRLSSGNGYVKESGIIAPGYPSIAQVDFLLGGLDFGTYNLQIKKSESDDYGLPIASFTIE
jgi:hypothetical protein